MGSLDFYCLSPDRSSSRRAEWADDVDLDQIICPVDEGHMRAGRRVTDLSVLLPGRRTRDIVWTWQSECLLTDRALDVFKAHGFPGFEVKGVTARFKGASETPPRLWELVLTGWAGMAPKETGIRLVRSCDACGLLRYSGAEHPEKLIDPRQWDGSDFFMVWPLPGFIFVTAQVATAMRESRITGAVLERPADLDTSGGFGPGRLSYYMPDARARTRRALRHLLKGWQVLCTVTADYALDTLGRMTRLTGAGATVDYAWDACSRLTRVGYDYDSGTITKAVGYVYDSSYRRATMVTPEDVEVTYLYDDAGRLSSILEGGALRSVYAYDLANRVSRLTYASGSYTTYGLDEAGRLTLVANMKSDDSAISTFGYLLDAAGLRRTMDIGGSAYTAASVAYAYDNAYQLTKETRTGGSAYTQEFHYDSGGSRTKSVLGGTTTTYYYDYLERMTKYGTNAVSWDVWGNMTRVYNHTYAWDDADRLTRFDRYEGTANDCTYGYIPGSWARYKRTQGGVTEYYVYDGDNVVGAYGSDGSSSARYVTPGLDSNLAETRGGSTYYYMADGLGSVRNVVDASETVQDTYDYYAFGNTLTASPANVTNPYRYTGREFESGSVLDTYYYRNRYYVSQLGIFMSRDAEDADPLRGWGYCANNPTMSRDPEGLYGEDIHDAATFFWALIAGLSYDEADRIANADQGFDTCLWTSPWNPLTGWRHFQSRDTVLRKMCRRVRKTGLTPEQLGAFLHQLQDSYAHYAHGYRWPPRGLGHIVECCRYDPQHGGTLPDDPNLIPDFYNPGEDKLDKDMGVETLSLLRAAAGNTIGLWCKERGF